MRACYSAEPHVVLKSTAGYMISEVDYVRANDSLGPEAAKWRISPVCLAVLFYVLGL